MNDGYDGLQHIIDEALGAMAAEAAGDFDPQGCNLAEFCRRTGLSRQRARTIKKNGFRARPHGGTGLKAAHTVLSGYTGTVDDLLRRGVTNSQVIFERMAAQGYTGGLTAVKVNLNSPRTSGRRTGPAPPCGAPPSSSTWLTSRRG